MHHIDLVEAFVVDPPFLTLDVRVLHVDLRCLGNTCELFMGGLSNQEAGIFVRQIIKAHAVPAPVDGMETHEGAPRFIEKYIVTQGTYLFQ